MVINCGVSRFYVPLARQQRFHRIDCNPSQSLSRGEDFTIQVFLGYITSSHDFKPMFSKSLEELNAAPDSVLYDMNSAEEQHVSYGLIL